MGPFGPGGPLHGTGEGFQSALLAARAVAWEWDLVTDRVSYSEGADELLGRTSGFPHELTWELIHPEDRERVRRSTEELLAGGTTLVLEYRTRRPEGGEWVWIEVSGRLERDASGKPRRVIGVTRDVTARRLLEEELRTNEVALRRSEERLADALRSTGTIAFDLDVARDEAVVSPHAAEILGTDIAGPGAVERALAIVHPADAAETRAYLRRALDHGEGWVQQVRIVRPDDGTERWLELRVGTTRDAGGRVRRLSGLVVDITSRKLAEQRVRESEDRLQRALAAGRMGVIDWDLATGLVVRSANFAEVFGILLPVTGPVDDAFALLHPDDRGRVRGAVEEARARGDAVAVEYRYVRPDGSAVWAEMRGNVVRDAAGRATRLRAVIADVDARRRTELALRRSEGRLRSLLHNTPLGVVEWDADFRISGWSGAAPQIFGFTEAEMLGRSLADCGLVPDDEWPKVREANARMTDPRNPYVISENRNLRKSGEVIHCVWYNSVFFDEGGRLESSLSLVLDVTERVEADAERAQLVDALRERAEALAEADRRKDEFLALLAHELRNPLAPIRNGVHILKRSADEAARAAALASMERQVSHMVRLVDDLLDVGRITRGKLRLERAPEELGGIVASAVEAARPAAEERGVALGFTSPVEPVVVAGDAARLSQVAANLVDNALKFTPEGGSVHVELARDAEDARLTVRDTGIGIAPERLDAIFAMFVQEDASLERAHGGLGIGLTLVRSLVELHGGRVRAESAGPEHGSAFTVTLPLAPAEACREHAAPPPGAAAAAALRVLVVDDSADAAESLASFLRLLGHETAIASDGPGALALLSRLRPDLVLCDVGMPGMSGLDVAREARRLFPRDAPRLVALTGYGGEQDRRRTLAAGFDEHLVKPVDVPALEALLARVAAELPPSGGGERRVEA